MPACAGEMKRLKQLKHYEIYLITYIIRSRRKAPSSRSEI